MLGTFFSMFAETDVNVEDIEQNVGVLKNYLDQLLPKVLSFGVRLIIAVVVFFIGGKIINLIRKHMRKYLERRETDLGVRQFIDSFLKVALYFILIVLIGTQFGIDTASIIAVVGSCGLAVGLALQGSLSNFAGGVLILMLKPFVVGDYIIEDTHKNEGTVKKIDLFYTTLKTVDNKEIIIPNGTLANCSLTNFTAQTKRRIDLSVGISYNADMKLAKSVIEQVILSEEKRDMDEESSVFVSELADSCVVIGFRLWTKTEDYWEVRWRVLENVKNALDKNAIEIPFPQMTVTFPEKP